jgi:hypothetical protein
LEQQVTATISHNEPAYSRQIALIVAVFSLLGFAVGAFLLLMYYSFSSMVHPDISEAERTKEIAKRFLFHDGVTQIVLIFVFALNLFCGLISFLLHMSAALIRKPTKRLAIVGTLLGGTICSVIFVSYFLWLGA